MSTSAAHDAGAPVSRSMDLRTGLMLIFPEWRGAEVVDAQVRMERKVTPIPSDWARQSETVLKKNQFEVTASDTSVKGFRAPFAFASSEEGQQLVQRVGMALSSEDITRVFQSPAPLSSEQLTLWFPPFPKSHYTEEFALYLHYRAQPKRAAFLTRQLVDLSTAGLWKVQKLPEGWGPAKPDGGYGDVPDAFELLMVEKGTAATIALKKAQDEVWLTYRLVTK